MPIEIRELNIKTTIKEEPGKQLLEIDVNELKEEIMVECIEAVLQVLQDKMKR